MTEKYDYSVPLNEMPMRHMIHSYDVKSWLEDNYDTIVHALKLAEKVMGEPSEGMVAEGVESDHTLEGMGEDYPDYEQSCRNIFQAMIAQAQKEIEPPQAGEEG